MIKTDNQHLCSWVTTGKNYLIWKWKKESEHNEWNTRRTQKKLPAKYDKKGKPYVGSDELPFPICVTPSRKGGHHFHFQHEPYSRRFVMCARNYYSCSVQLACMTRACSGRVNITPNNPNMIKCIGERQSKERKKTKIKKKYAIDWECPDTMLAENWKIIPSSVRAHCCNPQHPHKSTKDVITSWHSSLEAMAYQVSIARWSPG